MLIQIGLEDIVHFPSREQIAFLLVERARLLDELQDAHEVYQKTAEGHFETRLSEVVVANNNNNSVSYTHLTLPTIYSV